MDSPYSPKEGEIWSCRIKKVLPNCVIVIPEARWEVVHVIDRFVFNCGHYTDETREGMFPVPVGADYIQSVTFEYRVRGLCPTCQKS